MKTKPMLAVGAMVVTLLALAGLVSSTGGQAQALAPVEQLGKFLLFDTDLSTPAGQDCAACHAPQAGYTGPDPVINETLVVYPGAIHTRFGNRKPPSVAYGGDSPVLAYNQEDEVWVGGMFWDGRATGWTLGDPLAEQAQGPFLNPLEQNNPSAKIVCLKVRKAAYAGLFEEVWGAGSLDCGKGLDLTYEYILAGFQPQLGCRVRRTRSRDLTGH